MPVIKLLQSGQESLAVEIMVTCFGEHMRNAAEADIAVTFADYPYRPFTLLAWQNDKPVGVVQVLSSYFSPSTYSLVWLSVIPEARRQGIGEALANTAENLIIRERFKDKDGTFILVAAHDQKYYVKMGYIPGVLTHKGYPIMAKIHRATKA